MMEYVPGAGPRSLDATHAAARAEARERQAHVRHELRAPLAVIYPLLSLLRDGGPAALSPPQQQEYLEVLERSIVRLETLITGAVASGWADCSAAAPHPEEVALGGVAEELAALWRTESRQGVPVHVDAGAPPTPRAWADRDDVRQILADLVGNATTYTPVAGRVTVTARRGDAGTVELEVADTGPGMTPEELARAFEFGVRGELARQRRIPGLGAGLWVCRELARRNGGDIALAAEPGAGVTATVVLPAAEGDPA
jgi:two-component system sensor histidine kinase BaeS